MRFYKAHGLGNDYLVAEPGEVLTPREVRALCDRHRGIGADGLLEPVAAEGGSGLVRGVRIRNPDGSIAEKSGNGLRIFAWFLTAFQGAPPSFEVATSTGERVLCKVDGLQVTVEMGRATIGGGIDLVDGLRGIRVSVGNPHCVVWRDAPDLDALPWVEWGAAIEVDPRFPTRTNVQFARLVPDGAEVRIWERGAGATLASGSSACAVAASAVAGGARPPGRTLVHMPGGTLAIDVTSELDVTLTGPVGPIGWFDLDRRWKVTP